jgi:hypothetical protein
MLLDPIFERFAADNPICVMLRATLEHGLAPQPLDQLFAATADQQYTGELLFSTLVDLMGKVVCRIRPSLHAAYQARPQPLPVSLKAVYAKLERMEPGISAIPAPSGAADHRDGRRAAAPAARLPCPHPHLTR